MAADSAVLKIAKKRVMLIGGGEEIEIDILESRGGASLIMTGKMFMLFLKMGQKGRLNIEKNGRRVVGRASLIMTGNMFCCCC